MISIDAIFEADKEEAAELILKAAKNIPTHSPLPEDLTVSALKKMDSLSELNADETVYPLLALCQGLYKTKDYGSYVDLSRPGGFVEGSAETRIWPTYWAISINPRQLDRDSIEERYFEGLSTIETYGLNASYDEKEKKLTFHLDNNNSDINDDPRIWLQRLFSFYYDFIGSHLGRREDMAVGHVFGYGDIQLRIHDREG